MASTIHFSQNSYKVFATYKASKNFVVIPATSKVFLKIILTFLKTSTLAT
jgi:hypothetical protein